MDKVTVTCAPPCTRIGVAAHAVMYALGQLHGVHDFRAGQQDREFVATEARAGVARANLRLGAPRDFLERLVARQVAEAIVDLLEVVDVDHEAGQRLAGALGARQLLAQPVVEVAPVVPAGEEIGDAAAHQARTIHGVFQADRDDDTEVREKIRGQVAGEPFADRGCRRSRRRWRGCRAAAESARCCPGPTTARSAARGQPGCRVRATADRIARVAARAATPHR